MQMKSEFDSLVERMGLGEDERTLAEIFWKRAEKSVQGKPTQEALLLGGEPVNFEVRNTVILHNIETLTNEDIDFLVSINRVALTRVEEVKKLINRDIQVHWLLCDPDNPNTLEDFAYLNQLKSWKRKLKIQSNKLSSIQRKLKKAKGSC
jgi:hypothetical protein